MTYEEYEKTIGREYHQQELFESIDENMTKIEQQAMTRAKAKDIETWDIATTEIDKARAGIFNVFQEMEEEIRKLYNEGK